MQHISSIYADCDKDTLIVEVVKEDLACHTGAESCFFDPVYQNEEITPFSYEGLYDLIMGRKTNPKEGSYTTYLFDKGLDKILKKVGEECTEVIIAAAKKDKDETIYELADLCYHAMVLMADAGISVEDVTKELAKRHVVDHKGGSRSICGRAGEIRTIEIEKVRGKAMQRFTDSCMVSFYYESL